MTIHLHLFGRPSIHRNGDRLDLPLDRRHQLLAYCAAKGGWIDRTQLAGLLWPALLPKLANANLRKTLFRIQSQPWASAVEVEAQAVRVEAGSDLRDFEAALREGRAADALQLGQGEFLQGFDDGESGGWSDWLAFERERLRSAWRGQALQRMASIADAAEAVELASRLLEVDPIDEDALRAYMIWLARAGQVAAARRAYREFVERLQREFGLAPSAELQALHASLASSGAAPTTTPQRPHDDGFVGRTHELRHLGERLADEASRLLTVVGPGGIGKTSLARRALAEFGGRFDDGAAFVALEGASGEQEFAAALALELGVTAAGGADPLRPVIDHLRDRHQLLVLDNFEQLAACAAAVQRLLEGSPRLRLVVTSRVRLGLRTEWSLPLEGLPCPDPEDSDRLEAFDAARLFLRHAQRVEPALLPAAEADAIIDICRQVEGLPLALELAASWTRVLSCEAIAAELRTGTELLGARDAGLPARHGSMDAVFEHSWLLLGERERDALAGLSVFRGGFTAEAARRVTGAALPVLAALVDKSLLRKDGERLLQHPLILQLSAARLDGAARDAAQAAHARYFHNLLAQSVVALQSGDGPTLARVDAEFDNLRAAWHWAAAHAEGAPLVRSVPGLRAYCESQGRAREGLALMDEALAAFPSGFVFTHVKTAAAQLLYRLDRYEEAIAGASAALAAAQDLELQPQVIGAYRTLGSSHLWLGRLDEARRCYQLALAAMPDDRTLTKATTLDMLALVEKRSGRHREAIEMSQRALMEFRRLGSASAEALCLSNMASFEIDRGEYLSARAHLELALRLCIAHRLVSTHALVLANLAEVATQLGDPRQARAHAVASLEIALSKGNRALQAWLRVLLAQLAIGDADLDAAREELGTAATLAHTTANREMQLRVAIGLAELLSAQGDATAGAIVLRWLAADAALPSSYRRLVDTLLAKPGVPATPVALPDLSLAALVHRVAAEAALAHAPLIAALRGDA